MNTTGICKIFRRLGSAALLILALRLAMAQAPSAPPALQSVAPEPAHKPAAQLVTVEVIARDKNDQPVTGLTKDDFELFEDGVPQAVRIFAVGGSLSPSAAKAAPSPTLPPGIYTNIPPNCSDVTTSAAAIVLDSLNTDSTDLAIARLQVGKFLQKMQPQDRVAIYSMGKEVKVIHDFTSDPAALLQALNGGQPGAAASGTAQVPSLAGHAGDESNAPDDRLSLFLDIPKSDPTLGGLESIGQRIAGIPGRKSLIWISAGFPLMVKSAASAQGASQADDQSPKVREACRLLNKYSVAVYPMDVRGQNLGASALGSAASDTGKNGSPAGSAVTASSASSPGAAHPPSIGDNHESGYLLAKLTGGRAYYDHADLSAGIRTALDDSKLVYVLGFYPAPNLWDSQFHTFKVQAKRPDLNLAYRSGYVAVPEQQSADASDVQGVLAKSLLAPFDSSVIALFARLKPGTGANTTVIDLLVEVNDLALDHDGDHWKGKLDVVVAQRGSEQQLVTNGARRHTVDLNLPEDSYAKLRTKGLELLFEFTRDPGAADVRVIVHDARSGAVGTVTIPLNKT